MIHGLTEITMSITDSRDYYTRLALIDREQFELETHPGKLPLSEFHKRLQAMKTYRQMLNAMWGRTQQKC